VPVTCFYCEKREISGRKEAQQQKQKKANSVAQLLLACFSVRIIICSKRKNNIFPIRIATTLDISCCCCVLTLYYYFRLNLFFVCSIQTLLATELHMALNKLEIIHKESANDEQLQAPIALIDRN